MAELTIEIKADDLELLGSVADAEYRTPAQQASAFVHTVLMSHKAKADKPVGAVARRGPRSVAA